MLGLCPCRCWKEKKRCVEHFNEPSILPPVPCISVQPLLFRSIGPLSKGGCREQQPQGLRSGLEFSPKANLTKGRLFPALAKEFRVDAATQKYKALRIGSGQTKLRSTGTVGFPMGPGNKSALNNNTNTRINTHTHTHTHTHKHTVMVSPTNYLQNPRSYL